VVAPSPDERRLLELDKGAQVVRLRGVSFEPHGRSFDCFQQVYPASEVVFSISGQTARHVFRGTDLRDWSVTPVAGGAAARDRAAHPPPAPPIAPVETPGTRVGRQPQVSERGGNV
jgi:hypothetical protein